MTLAANSAALSRKDLIFVIVAEVLASVSRGYNMQAVSMLVFVTFISFHKSFKMGEVTLLLPVSFVVCMFRFVVSAVHLLPI